MVALGRAASPGFGACLSCRAIVAVPAGTLAHCASRRCQPGMVKSGSVDSMTT